jgi:S-layer homology domain
MPRTLVSKFLLGVLAALCLVPSVARSQDYGLNSQDLIIPAFQFAPTFHDYHFVFGANGLMPTEAQEQTWVASVGVPDGAIIDEIDVLVVDNDGAANIAVAASFSGFPVSGSGACGGTPANGTSTGITGQGTIVMASPFGTAPLKSHDMCNGVDSWIGRYVTVTMLSSGQSLAGAHIAWHRSVSPAPATSSFGDVPTTDGGFQYIEALVASGVTAGCGGGNYCPDATLTRRQMAVFLSKALGLHWGQLPPGLR